MNVQHPNSRKNIGKGRPATGRKSYRANLLPSEEQLLKAIDKNRGAAISRLIQLVRIAYPHMSELEDTSAMAWCDEVEPLLIPKATGSAIEVRDKEDGETKAWIV